MDNRGKPKTPEERQKRRDEVLNYMKSIGPFSIPAKSLAKKYDVTPQLIYDDRDYWIKRINFKKIDLVGKKILMSLEKNMELTEILRAKGKEGIRIKAIAASNNTAEVFTKLLENYGFKEKIAEKLDLREHNVIINEVTKSVEEIKSERNRNNLKSKTKSDA